MLVEQLRIDSHPVPPQFKSATTVPRAYRVPGARRDTGPQRGPSQNLLTWHHQRCWGACNGVREAAQGTGTGAGS